MNYITVDIPSAHGKKYPLTIPDNGKVTIAYPPRFDSLPNPKELIRNALDNPIGSERIEDRVKPGQKICIISDDITRPTPVSTVLEELLPRLHNAGIKKEDIFFVFAIGSHRRMTFEEMEQKLGKDVCAQYPVMNSEFRDPEQLIEVGTSELGTPIRVFRKAMEADFRISIGNIIPHGCMGWSGGAKILYPGITAEDIVSEFHVMQGFQDGIVYGMDECPVRLAVEEWTKNIGLHFIINTSLTGDMQIYRVVAGDFIKAHRVGVQNSKESLGVKIKEKPNIVVTTSYPTDMDLWQCSKGVYGGGKVIAQDGTMLLMGPCTEGIGPHKDYAVNLGRPDGLDSLKAKIEAHETGEELLSLAVGASIGKLHKVCKIHWMTNGISEDELKPSGFIWHPEEDIQKVFDEVYKQYDDPTVLVIPIGAETLPYLE